MALKFLVNTVRSHGKINWVILSTNSQQSLVHITGIPMLFHFVDGVLQIHLFLYIQNITNAIYRQDNPFSSWITLVCTGSNSRASLYIFIPCSSEVCISRLCIFEEASFDYYPSNTKGSFTLVSHRKDVFKNIVPEIVLKYHIYAFYIYMSCHCSALTQMICSFHYYLCTY